MRKPIYIYLLFFGFTFFNIYKSQSQILSAGIKLNDPEWNYEAVEKLLDKQLLPDENVKVFNPGKRWFGDTLQYHIYYNETSIFHRYVFDVPDKKLKSDSKCIYQEYRTACDRCGDELVQFLTNSKNKYGFKKMEDGSYLSKLKYRTHLIICNLEEEEICLRLLFKPISYSEEEYQRIYKSLIFK